MATILIAWELGGGLGHLSMLDPPAREWLRRGHRVVAALRDLSRAEEVFAGSGVEYLQSPLRTRRVADPFPSPCTFPQILHNVGLANLPEMRAVLGAWRTIYDTVRPDLVVFDHAPSAILAARGRDFVQAATGTGFCVPPDVFPFPDWRPWHKTPPEQLQRDEVALLAALNQLLAEAGQPPLERIGQLYGDLDEPMLTTFAELDHYGPRAAARYWGVWHSMRGATPQWPVAQGPRV
ncbi:MAG: hypothetical protein KDA42_05820, partial [Planctomycetales bacterium]|nr:hypothetical protein [Planctomycetales bacterium]